MPVLDIQTASTLYLSYDTTRYRGRVMAVADIPSPVADDICYHTTLDQWCFYDGTRWLTCQEYMCVVGYSDSLSVTVSATTSNIRLGLVRSDRQIYLTRGEALIGTGATNDGARYFQYDIKDNTGATLWSFNTSAAAAASTVSFSTTSFTQPGGTRTYLFLDATAVGVTPSAQVPRSPILFYRLIAP